MTLTDKPSPKTELDLRKESLLKTFEREDSYIHRDDIDELIKEIDSLSADNIEIKRQLEQIRSLLIEEPKTP